MLVKICGFTRAQDIEAAGAAGADAIGLVFDEGRHCVDVEQGRQLLGVCRRLSRRVDCIAVTGQLTLERVAPLRALGFDGIQAGVCPWQPELESDDTYLLPAFFDSDDLVERVAAHRAAYPLKWDTDGRSLRGMVNIDSAAGGGTGQSADWQRAAVVCKAGPTALAGGLRPDNVATAIAITGALAVDVCSGVEHSPGIKDAALMRAFVDAARGC